MQRLARLTSSRRSQAAWSPARRRQVQPESLPAEPLTCQPEPQEPLPAAEPREAEEEYCRRVFRHRRRAPERAQQRR